VVAYQRPRYFCILHQYPRHNLSTQGIGDKSSGSIPMIKPREPREQSDRQTGEAAGMRSACDLRFPERSADESSHIGYQTSVRWCRGQGQ
jgi:hypothetical protein